jgi:hypothetical protein
VYPDVAGLMPTLAEDYALNPIGSLVTVRCWPWVIHGDESILALVGDAAHAIVPFFGQGANCAFEDCIEIDQRLSEAHGDWDRALITYQQRRKENTDVIADLALDNFVEMRNRVNSPIFRARTWAEHALERRFPGRYLSRYELVSFTTIPYAQIEGRIRRQDRAVGAQVLVELRDEEREAHEERQQGTGRQAGERRRQDPARDAPVDADLGAEANRDRDVYLQQIELQTERWQASGWFGRWWNLAGWRDLRLYRKLRIPKRSLQGRFLYFSRWTMRAQLALLALVIGYVAEAYLWTAKHSLPPESVMTSSLPGFSM